MKKLALACALICACSGEPTDDEFADDHSVDRLVLEGTQITDLLGDDLVSDPIQTSGFRRVGFLWDALGEQAFEVRTSFDGVLWTEWRAPDVVSVEQESHAGHVDAVAGIGAEGSVDSDPRAVWYQLRVIGGGTLPTFMVVEPLVHIPALIVEDVNLPETQEPDEIAAVVRPTPIGSIKIHSRADWGARRPRCSMSSQTPTRATIHHTVTPTNDSMSPQARLRQIQAFHMFTNGWCDIGYNYLVSRDGRIWRGRGATTVGAHVENSNTGNVGVSFIGTYTSTAPTETQMCNSAKLLRRLHEDFGGVSLNRTDVKGHRQLGSTACPGTALYNRIDKILRKARGGCAVN
ncbi:MAG TPA: N-acetylmuramoyl-L-alanine amidase [Kofleriaceae bacterium]